MCRVLRPAMAILRLVTCAYADQGATEDDLLFDRTIKIHLSDHLLSNNNHHNRSTSSSSSSASTASTSVSASSSASASFKRPALAVLLDMLRYCVRVMVRSGEVQSKMRTDYGADSSSSPALSAIRHLVTFLLEHDVYLFVEHAQIYLSQLVSAQLQSQAQLQALARQQQAQQAQLSPWDPRSLHAHGHAHGHGHAGYAGLYGSASYVTTRPSPPSEAEVAHAQRAKLVDLYRERLAATAKALGSYLAKEREHLAAMQVSQLKLDEQKKHSLLHHVVTRIDDILDHVERLLPSSSSSSSASASASASLYQQQQQQQQQQSVVMRSGTAPHMQRTGSSLYAEPSMSLSLNRTDSTVSFDPYASNSSTGTSPRPAYRIQGQLPPSPMHRAFSSVGSNSNQPMRTSSFWVPR